MKIFPPLVFGLAGSFLFVSTAIAQNSALTWFSIDGGGGSSSANNFTLNGVIGQPDAGHLTASKYSLEGGFLSAFAGERAVEPGELIVNGSFENTQDTFLRDGNGVMSVVGDSHQIAGWTTGNAELAWLKNDNVFGAVTPSGDFFLDLTGYHDGPPFGGVTQTIKTAPGHHYQLTLALGSNSEYPNAGGQKSVAVGVGTLSTTFVFDPTASERNEWKKFAFNFTASESLTKINITGAASGGGVYIGLDNVSVLPRGPELTAPIVERAGTGLHITFTVTANQNYIIESLDDLLSSAWSPLTDAEVSGTGVRIAVPDRPGTSHKFYRIRVAP